MENKKPGRPKSDKPTRNKTITLRLSESEFDELQKICYDNRLAYADVLLQGLKHWSDKK